MKYITKNKWDTKRVLGKLSWNVMGVFSGLFYIALIMTLKLQQIVNMALGFLIKKWHNSITVNKHASWKFNYKGPLIAWTNSDRRFWHVNYSIISSQLKFVSLTWSNQLIRMESDGNGCETTVSCFEFSKRYLLHNSSHTWQQIPDGCRTLELSKIQTDRTGSNDLEFSHVSGREKKATIQS